MSDGIGENLKLATVLERVSGSLDSLADIVHGVEHAIGNDLGAGQSLSMEKITRLQHLDLIRQTLEDLSILSLALSKDRDGIVQPEIADKLRLAATRKLLSALPKQVEAKPPAVAVSGSIDLF